MLPVYHRIPPCGNAVIGVTHLNLLHHDMYFKCIFRILAAGAMIGGMEQVEYADWRRRLEADAVPPEGFRSAVVPVEFVPLEKPEMGARRMNLALIRGDGPIVSFAGVFTKNAFPGWPVVVGRSMMEAHRIRGVLVNNTIANVGTRGGREDSEALARGIGAVFGDSEAYIPSSTGVIGWKLPVEKMTGALPALRERMDGRTILPFAEGIMTTDAWPKVRSADCGEGRVVGTAKGAGMVEPDMATMLAFILTDVDVCREDCRRILPTVVEESFNRMSVDGEMSTSDTVLLLASGRKPYPGDGVFTECLSRVASALAEDVVRGGEGCAHVLRVRVSGARDDAAAVYLARSIVNAPLTKTAIRGNDPNVGRILQALGAACVRNGQSLDAHGLMLSIGGIPVYEMGHFKLQGREEVIQKYLKERELPLPAPRWPRNEDAVEIDVSLGKGGGRASVIGSDLSEEYVKINADYRS